jgi:hypothetical protein
MIETWVSARTQLSSWGRQFEHPNKGCDTGVRAPFYKRGALHKKIMVLETGGLPPPLQLYAAAAAAASGGGACLTRPPVMPPFFHASTHFAASRTGGTTAGFPMGLAGFAVPPGFLHHHGAAALGPRFASLAASVVGANNRQHEPGTAVDLGTGSVLRRRVMQLTEDSASEGTSPKKGKVINAFYGCSLAQAVTRYRSTEKFTK